MKISENLWQQLIDYRSEVIRLQAHIFELEEKLASERWFIRGVIEENKRLRYERSKTME